MLFENWKSKFFFNLVCSVTSRNLTVTFLYPVAYLDPYDLQKNNVLARPVHASLINCCNRLANSWCPYKVARLTPRLNF